MISLSRTFVLWFLGFQVFARIPGVSVGVDQPSMLRRPDGLHPAFLQIRDHSRRQDEIDLTFRKTPNPPVSKEFNKTLDKPRMLGNTGSVSDKTLPVFFFLSLKML